MVFDLEDQYDKLYRYCYFKLRHGETAEDITQEAFLRYWERYHPLPAKEATKILYTIARNLCIDQARKQEAVPLDEQLTAPPQEDKLLHRLSVQNALQRLSLEERELLLLRYVNQIPIATIAALLNTSRFAVYRKTLSAVGHFRRELRKEDLYDELEK
jgi:RNA polymerase sigma-70 factor (ECF subfamily)